MRGGAAAGPPVACTPASPQPAAKFKQKREKGLSGKVKSALCWCALAPRGAAVYSRLRRPAAKLDRVGPIGASVCPIRAASGTILTHGFAATETPQAGNLKAREPDLATLREVAPNKIAHIPVQQWGCYDMVATRQALGTTVHTLATRLTW
jgi:hypothetical protein